MADDAQAFLFNVEEWFASVAQQRMTFAEKGVYLSMLFQQWREKGHSLPDSPGDVAELIAVTEGQVAEVEAAWPVVRRKFVTSKHTPGRIYNVKLEETRRRQRAAFKARAVAGRKGGEARARNLRARKQIDPVANVAKLQVATANASNAQANRSVRTGKDRTGKDWTGSVLAGTLPRDHMHHAVCGRACLHQSQLGRFIRRLGGPPADAEAAIRDWAMDIAQRWSLPPLDQQPIGENDFAFWDARFAEWQPSTGKAKAAEQDEAFTAALKRGPSVRPS